SAFVGCQERSDLSRPLTERSLIEHRLGARFICSRFNGECALSPNKLSEFRFSTIQSSAARTTTSSYCLWVDLLLVAIITFSCVGYLLSVGCECALLLVEILAITLSLCVCECGCLTDQREQLWCGGGC